MKETKNVVRGRNTGRMMLAVKNLTGKSLIEASAAIRDATGISLRSARNWLLSDNPTLETLCRLAASLNVQPSELMNELLRVMAARPIQGWCESKKWGVRRDFRIVL